MKVENKTKFKEKKPQFASNGNRKIAKVHYQGKEHEVELISKFDFSGFERETILRWYKLNHLGRRLDEKAALYLKMAKGWSYHAPFGGHDGIQLALGQVFRQKKDFLFPYYRDMMTSLSAGLTPEEIILNGLSKEDDVAGGGRHMSNHFAKPSINIQNVSSCTGNHAQHAAGLARAIKKYGGDEIVFYSGGESATAEGYFYEAINCASTERLPVVFVIQNNQYGISVPLRDVMANLNVAQNFAGLPNIKILNCDGRDPFDSFRALTEAIEYIRSGSGAAIVHAECDRIGSHSNSDRHEIYRSPEELETVRRRDPLLQFRYHILAKGIATEEELEKIEAENQRIIFEAADKVEKMPNADGSQWNKFILPEPYVPKNATTEEYQPEPDAPLLSYREAINIALIEEFQRNPNTFLWGQDIGKGGVFNVVKGMPEMFGKERVFNAPIAEDNIVGTANGFCRYRDDIRVVIEGAEFADYFWPAMEQLVESSHDYWRTKGQYTPNVVIRLASGGYIQGGLYHSQNIEGALTTIPGIRIVTPAFADDAIGLMRNAIRSKGVTVYLEPKFLYNFKNAYAPKPHPEFVVPFGKAKIRRQGSDITVVAYGTAVHLSLLAAKELERESISVEVIDLRSLIPWDEELVYESVKKTNRVVVVHEDKVTGGFGGEIVARITENVFNYLDAPILRVGSKDCPVGFAKEYENAILPNTNDVAQAIRKVVKW
jgi:2-oxoisovalerate dehydrogenase E1 component